MIIHVVQKGETIKSIADQYGVNLERLIQDNDIMNADNLAVGQAIIIVYPSMVHTVQEGDNLAGIAMEYRVTVMQILRNNSYLLDRKYIYPGETLVITYADEKTGNISTNGYAYPYIDLAILRKNLLYLTYLSVYSYTVTADGNLNDIDDTELIQTAKSFCVAPIMVLSNISEGGIPDSEIIHSVLHDEEIKNKLIENTLNILRRKGYYGINVDIPFIMAEDRQLFLDFFSDITERLHQEGFKVFVTITPNSFEVEAGSTYEAVDYSILGEIADSIIILSYSWGNRSEVPIEASPFNLLILLLEYVLGQIPREKIMIGISSIGYVWKLPYEPGVSKANSISNANAVQLASNVGAEIIYNPDNLSSYFYYTDVNNYFVYFHDARGVDTALKSMTAHGLKGVGIWNIMYYLAQTFLVINTQYNIDTVY